MDLKHKSFFLPKKFFIVKQNRHYNSIFKKKMGRETAN